MISEFEIYLITRCDAISTMLTIIAILSFFGFVGSIIYVFVTLECFRDSVKFRNNVDFYSKRFLGAKILCGVLCFVSVLFSALAVAMPDTKEAAIIYTVPKLLRSDFAQKDMPKEAMELYGLVKKYLESKVDERK